jgi:hypothetical protein
MSFLPNPLGGEQVSEEECTKLATRPGTHDCLCDNGFLDTAFQPGHAVCHNGSAFTERFPAACRGV